MHGSGLELHCIRSLDKSLDEEPIFQTIQHYTALDQRSIQYLQGHFESQMSKSHKLMSLLCRGKLEIYEWKRGMVLGSSREDGQDNCLSRPFVNVKLCIRLPSNALKTHIAELSPSEFQVRRAQYMIQLKPSIS